MPSPQLNQVPAFNYQNWLQNWNKLHQTIHDTWAGETVILIYFQSKSSEYLSEVFDHHGQSAPKLKMRLTEDGTMEMLQDLDEWERETALGGKFQIHIASTQVVTEARRKYLRGDKAKNDSLEEWFNRKTDPK